MGHREQDGVRTTNVATGFTRGWETFANTWAMFWASVRRHIFGCFALAVLLSALSMALELGPLAQAVPSFLAATVRGAPIDVYVEAFGGRTVGFLLRFLLGRSVLIFLFLALFLGALMALHGRRLMSGRRRRGVRITTWEAEVRRKKTKDVLGTLGLTLCLFGLPRAFALRAEDKALFDYGRVVLAQASKAFAWCVSRDGRGEEVWLEASMEPGFYRAAEASRYLSMRCLSQENLLRLAELPRSSRHEPTGLVARARRGRSSPPGCWA